MRWVRAALALAVCWALLQALPGARAGETVRMPVALPDGAGSSMPSSCESSDKDPMLVWTASDHDSAFRLVADSAASLAPDHPRSFALPGALARAVAAWRAGETFTFPAALEASKDGYGGGGGGGELGGGGIGAASGGDAFLSSLTEARHADALRDPPRNVTTGYHGSWWLVRDPSLSPALMLTLGGTGGDGDIGAGAGSDLLNLKRNAGRVVASFHDDFTAMDDVSLVTGDMVLRTGEFVGDASLGFSCEGTYFRSSGLLRLRLRPKVDREDGTLYLTRLTSVLDPNTTMVADAVGAAAGAAASGRLGDHPKSICGFEMVAVASALPSLPLAVYAGDLFATRPVVRPSLSFRGFLYSPNCGISLAANVTSIDYDTFFRKSVTYATMVAVVAIAQLLVVAEQLRVSATPSAASKLSLMTVGQLAVMDCYSCLMHLTSGIVVEPVFRAFATIAFVKFVMLSSYEMRLLLRVWKARHPRAFNMGAVEMRRQLSVLYSRFYVALLVGMMAFFQLHDSFSLFALIAVSMWVPQIIHNAQRDSSRSLTSRFVAVQTISRLVVPAYVHLCPENIFRARPRPLALLAILAYAGIQVAVLMLQDKYGARFFLPSNLFEAPYDYHGRVDDADIRSQDCVICMGPVDVDHGNPTGHMVTPCGHLFHAPCLGQWLDIRLECPTCRAELPPNS